MSTSTLTAVIVNYDNHGSFWGHSTPEQVNEALTVAETTGTPIDEWQTTDRNGHPLRVVRVPDPTFLDDIYVFTEHGQTSR